MTKKTYKFYVGVDVGKYLLDVSLSNQSSILQFSNNEEGFKKLLKSLPSKNNTLVVFEASGGYEKKISDYLLQKKFNVVIVNAKRVRDFAKASGKLAKTDVIDAQIIMLFGKAFNPHPKQLHSAIAKKREEQIMRRNQLVNILTVEKQYLEHASNANKRSINKHIRFLEKELASTEIKLKQLFTEDETSKDQLERLNEIQGVGEITAMSILTHLPELGKINHKQISALAGVAPFNKDSGQNRGKRKISGGRMPIRKALYMATLSAKKHNPILKKFYNHLISKGKLKKVAIIACMRKLLIIMNAMISNNTRWMAAS